jgi:3-oxoacyl-[acyl-carrier protein] reductase
MQRFEGRVALVTGAAGGIGQAVCRRLASEGAAIVATDLQASMVEPLVSELNGQRAESALALNLDVREKSSAVQVVNAAVQRFGKLDVLVNNAGIFAKTALLDIQADRWDALMAINLRGVLLCSQAALEAMISDGRGGAIVNLASLAGQVGGVVAGADYAASKAGVVALTKSLAKVAAPYAIRVNAVNPGVIDTAMPAQFPPEARAKMIDDTPLKRMGKPEEVASAIAFLASDDASFITGTTLDINGGLYV